MSDQVTEWLEGFRSFVNDDGGVRRRVLDGRTGPFPSDATEDWRNALKEIDDQGSVLYSKLKSLVIPIIATISKLCNARQNLPSN